MFRSRISAIPSLVEAPCLKFPFRMPLGAPLPRPPCILHTRFPRTAGALQRSCDASTKAVTAIQGRLCQSRLIEVLGGLVHRDMTTHHGLSSNSFKGECSTQGPDAFAHSRQASTERSAIGKADAIINNRHDDFGLLEPHTNPNADGVCVFEDIGQGFLNGSIDRISNDVVRCQEPNIELKLETGVRSPGFRILYDIRHAPFQSQLSYVNWAQAIQNPTIGVLERFDSLLKLGSRGIIALRIVKARQQRIAVGANCKKQGTKLIMQFARKIPSFLLLKNYQAPKEPGIFGAELRQG